MKSVVEKCCGEGVQRSVVGKSFVEKCCGGVL